MLLLRTPHISAVAVGVGEVESGSRRLDEQIGQLHHHNECCTNAFSNFSGSAECHGKRMSTLGEQSSVYKYLMSSHVVAHMIGGRAVPQQSFSHSGFDSVQFRGAKNISSKALICLARAAKKALELTQLQEGQETPTHKEALAPQRK